MADTRTTDTSAPAASGLLTGKVAFIGFPPPDPKPRPARPLRDAQLAVRQADRAPERRAAQAV
ncbi:hypothetical protein JBE04_34515 [Streptomyces sp. PRKS01-29]|nr:hypothetical protein [Streptomyces sabulosicollis]MBI0299437.1 hypothetical protein [Streptomyces sabulosicollis]